MGDKERLEELKKTPSLCNQGRHGCCGFAGTLMGLLVHADAEVDKLCKTINDGALYQGVKQSAAVKNRLQKRLDLGLLEANETHSLDMRLAVGLMITFKEHLLQEKKENVWKACQKYSELFESAATKEHWKYGGHLKDHQKNVNAPPAAKEFAFSYKHGDIALTIDAQQELLSLVGFKSVGSTRLIGNKDLAGFKKNLPLMAAHKGLKDSLTQLADGLYKGTYAGAMVGVAKKDFIGENDHEPYEYIAHWVYMPRPAGAVPVKIFDSKVWTWGRETTLHTLLKSDKQYVPKVAVTFEKP